MTLSDEISDIYLQIGPNHVLLIDAINDWADRVLKLLFDSRERDPRPDAFVWNLYDLVASLIRRDAIERAISSRLGTGSRISLLAAADELFSSFTRAINIDVAALTEEDPQPHDENWWWHRIPTEGPLAAEAEAILRDYFE